MYDLMIIGSGPAGISAALTAKIRKLNFIWFGSRSLSQKVEKAEQIMNYPGLPAVTGKEMQGVFLRQIDEMGIQITEEKVDFVYPMGNSFSASVKDKIYEAKSVILAIGMASTKVLPGEEELLGRGVSYCATCDGNFYKQKNIAVVCTNPKFEEEIEYLSDLAASVEVFTTYQDFGLERDNVKQVFGLPKSINGSARVESVTDKNGEVPVDGIFLLKDSVSPGILLKGLQMQENHIVVDRQQQTSIPGCFAAGDCTGRPYQYTKAVGEGNVAAHSVLSYLKEASSL